MSAVEWRPIPGFAAYAASSDGRIRSFQFGRPRDLTGSLSTRGYRQVILVRDGERATRTVHSLVCEAFHGPRPEGMVTRHLDGDQLHNAASNLTWGTQSENARDKVRHGTHHLAKRTHCPQSHPYDEVNTYLHQGRRHCRACMAARDYARKVARALRAAAISGSAVA